MLIQVLAVISQLGKPVELNIMERTSEGHVAAAMVMPIAFAIRCDVDEAGRGPVLAELVQQPLGELLSVVEQSLKCYSLRNVTIIKEQIHNVP